MDQASGALLLNFDGIAPEDIVNDPSTPETFRDLDKLSLVEIEPIKREDIDGNKFNLTFDTQSEQTMTALARAEKIMELTKMREKE